MALRLREQTKEEFLARLGREYASREGESLASLCRYIVQAQAAGDLTDNDLDIAFRTAGKNRDSFKQAISDIVAADNAVRSAKSALEAVNPPQLEPDPGGGKDPGGQKDPENGFGGREP